MFGSAIAMVRYQYAHIRRGYFIYRISKRESKQNMGLSITFELAIFLFYLFLGIGALLTLCSPVLRALSEYGKQTVGNYRNFLFISKKKYFGHMYIVAFLMTLFALYQIIGSMLGGHKSSLCAFLSTHARSVAPTDRAAVRLAYECITRKSLSCI